jgi:glycosyltransferase involved in cell wall biosynthesis
LSKKPLEIFSVELELAPYKFDLWNEFTHSGKFNITTFFTEEKNYEKDAGHNYLSFPKADFIFSVESGKTIKSKLFSIFFILKNILKSKFDYIYIAGYNHFVTFSTVLLCILLNKKYLLKTDMIVFNNRKRIQNLIKKYFLKNAHRILVCNLLFSDKKYIRNHENIFKFPYYVSKERLLSDSPKNKPAWLKSLFSTNKTILFVSSRLIPRKGCDILLKAFSTLERIDNIVLLIEGEGSEYDSLNQFIEENNLSEHIKLLGFSQFKTHSWLIRNSDIIIVPSHEDNWGIVVDEGLKLNKIVISTFSTGSAISLIENGINGYLYESTNSKELAKLLDHCILKTSSEKVEFSEENSSQEIKLSNALFQNLKVFS